MCVCVSVCLNNVNVCVKQISPEWALAAAEVAAREDDFTDEDSEIDSDEEHQNHVDGDSNSSYDKVIAAVEREW